MFSKILAAVEFKLKKNKKEKSTISSQKIIPTHHKKQIKHQACRTMHEIVLPNLQDEVELQNSKQKAKSRKCCLRWQNGTVYSGQTSQNAMNGKGKLCYPNGDYYEGQFVDNKFHGYGGYYHKDRKFYEGQWINDQKHGYGKEMLEDGIIYTGNFQNNLKQGLGYIEWKDGSYYQGYFQNDKMNGNGKMVLKDGTFYKGEWENNFLNGKGLEISKLSKAFYLPKENNELEIISEQMTFQGQFLQYKKNGRGSLLIQRLSLSNQKQLNKNKFKIEGFWHEGKLEGRVIVHEQDKQNEQKTIIRSAKAIQDKITYVTDIEYQQTKNPVDDQFQ